MATKKAEPKGSSTKKSGPKKTEKTGAKSGKKSARVN